MTFFAYFMWKVTDTICSSNHCWFLIRHKGLERGEITLFVFSIDKTNLQCSYVSIKNILFYCYHLDVLPLSIEYRSYKCAKSPSEASSIILPSLTLSLYKEQGSIYWLYTNWQNVLAGKRGYLENVCQGTFSPASSELSSGFQVTLLLLLLSQCT